MGCIIGRLSLLISYDVVLNRDFLSLSDPFFSGVYVFTPYLPFYLLAPVFRDLTLLYNMPTFGITSLDVLLF